MDTINIKKKYDIFGIGAALVDTEILVSDEFLAQHNIGKGLMTLVDEERQYYLIKALNNHTAHKKKACGGSACNSIVAASSFGADTFYAGKVASDKDGGFFVKDLNAAGVTFHRIKPKQGITGKCLVMVTPDAERTMNTFLGANLELTDDEVEKDELAASEWLYVEGYLVTDDARTEVAAKAMVFANEKGIKTSLSLSDPFVVEVFAQNIARVIGEGVDLLFCNEDEALSYTQSQDIESAIEGLKGIAKTFVVTRGKHGATAFDGQKVINTKGVATEAVDTNGAGDMFAGAFLYAITSGHDYSWALTFANAAAARVVSRFGPRIDPLEYDCLKNEFGIN
jgi:sugar/nucleoside kinase (ribokinase family)